MSSFHKTRPDLDSLGIYIHFPWCLQKCSYCDFYSVGMLDKKSKIKPKSLEFLRMIDEYVSTVAFELKFRYEQFESYKYVDTIFFGGGTASLLPPDKIKELLDAIEYQYAFSNDIEITLEGNPENFTQDYLESLHQAGINRINVGLQTWNKKQLESMNRYYDSDNYSQILHLLSDSKIKNIGADLIYGFPNQTVAQFHNDLEKILESRLNHISIYSLTVEKGTVYGNMVDAKDAKSPEEKLQNTLFKQIPEILKQHEFLHYEVSNFSKQNKECKHNLRYWLFEHYMGLGPGAHGFNGKKRYGNVRNTQLWQQNPTSASFCEVDITNDFLLGYMRLTMPLNIEYMVNILKVVPGFSKDKMIQVFEGWVKKDIVIQKSPIHFQWTIEGLLFLDDCILELTSELEKQST